MPSRFSRLIPLFLFGLVGLLGLAACGAHQGASDAGPRDGGSLHDGGGDAGPLDGGLRADAGLFEDGGALGGFLVDGGAWFRVWAPDAQAVSVSGDFGSAPLAAQGDGTFSGGVAGAHSMQQYQYEIDTGVAQLERTDPRAQLVGADPGGQEPPGVLYDPAGYAWTASYTPATARNAVIYELHLGTFVDPSDNGTGTYTSAATKLADLAQLGINAIEIMPVNEFPGDYSWGYNPIYPFAPCRAYGAPDELQALIDQAHQLGMSVILDVVFNHFGLDDDTHPSLSMWCFDGPCDGGGIYFEGEDATPFGPRPAFGTPQVHDLILDSLKSWLINYRADGFRWDSVVYTRSDTPGGADLPEGARLIKDANIAVHALNPSALTLGEDLSGWDAITQPVDPTQLDNYSSGYGFDGQWDDGFYYALEPLLIAPDDSSRDVTTLVSPLNSGSMTNVLYTENHDKVAPQNGADHQRIPALIGLSQNGYWARRRSGLGLALVFTTPGIPMIFMGQEFLETTPFPFNQGPALDWTNETANAPFRAMVHDLIALRKNAAGNTRGLLGDNTAVIEAANRHSGSGDAVSPMIAFHRWDQGGPGDDTVVAANFSNVQLSLPIGFPASGTWHVRFNSDETIYSADYGGTPSNDVNASGPPRDGMAQSGTVALGPYSVVVLSQ